MGLLKESHERKKKGTEVVSGVVVETGLVKKFIIHRFDSLAKVVVSAVFQGSVDSFPETLLLIMMARYRRHADPRFGLIGDSSADEATDETSCE